MTCQLYFKITQAATNRRRRLGKNFVVAMRGRFTKTQNRTPEHAKRVQRRAQHTLLARQSILRRAHRYWGDAGGKRVLTSRACKVDNHLLDQRVPLCGVAQIQAYQEV